MIKSYRHGEREHGCGWVPDFPDWHRDHTPDRNKQVADFIRHARKKAGISEPAKSSGLLKLPPSSLDLRGSFSPVEDQLQYGSCTSHAYMGLWEYYQKLTYGTHIDGSRMFLYYMTRWLLGWKGDTGAYLRTTMKAAALFGVPPEAMWRYIAANLDKEPTVPVGLAAAKFPATGYYRLDTPQMKPDELLNGIKAQIVARLPLMFGFAVPPSISQAASNGGRIPFFAKGEGSDGGHAIDAIGYDDKIEITNAIDNSKTVGAIMIRNSWGRSWGGDGGYGYLPYEFVLQRLANDFWWLFSANWLDIRPFN